MKNQINTIDKVLSQLGIEIDDFFIVSFWKTNKETCLQGHYTEELFSKLSSLLDKGFVLNKVDNTYNFINKDIMYIFTIS